MNMKIQESLFDSTQQYKSGSRKDERPEFDAPFPLWLLHRSQPELGSNIIQIMWCILELQLSN